MVIGRIGGHGGVNQEFALDVRTKGRESSPGPERSLHPLGCLHVAATLRGFLNTLGAGKNEIGDLAIAAACDTYALHRVLTHLVGRGVFEEPSPGRFTLNEAAQGLLDPAVRLGLDLEGIGGRMAHAWGTLPGSVRTGSPAYHGQLRPVVLERSGRPSRDRCEFRRLDGGRPDDGAPNADFEITEGWARVRTVVDVGGGSGAMLAELLH